MTSSDAAAADDDEDDDGQAAGVKRIPADRLLLKQSVHSLSPPCAVVCRALPQRLGGTLHNQLIHRELRRDISGTLDDVDGGGGKNDGWSQWGEGRSFAEFYCLF